MNWSLPQTRALCKGSHRDTPPAPAGGVTHRSVTRRDATRAAGSGPPAGYFFSFGAFILLSR